MVVCHAAQEAKALHLEYADRKKENMIFTLKYLWFERNQDKDHGAMTQNPTCVKIERLNL